MASKPDSSPTQERADYADFSIAIVGGLALALTILFLFAVPVAGKLSASRDFVSYWATGQQLVRHANPYDRDAVAALEHSAGLTVKAVLIMRNPPWALPLAYPLGFLPLRLAGILWSLILLACLLISVRMVRELHGAPPNRIHWLGFAFTPGLICLTMGQTALFALLGLVLFLRLHQSRPFAAGAALWLCALKPHLFLPFAAALAAWIVVSRGYKLLAGAAAAIALSSAAAFAIDPTAWRDYIQLMRSPAVENEFIPCLADAMRHWLLPQAAWLQYLPAALCCLWALIYFLAPPRCVGLGHQQQPAHAGFPSGCTLLLVLRSVPGDTGLDAWRLRHALSQAAGGPRAGDSGHGWRNLRRPGRLAAVALDRARMACLVSPGARLSR